MKELHLIFDPLLDDVFKCFSCFFCYWRSYMNEKKEYSGFKFCCLALASVCFGFNLNIHAFQENNLWNFKSTFILKSSYCKIVTMLANESIIRNTSELIAYLLLLYGQSSDPLQVNYLMVFWCFQLHHSSARVLW